MKSKWQKIKIGEISNINTFSYSQKDNWDFVNYLDTGNITNNQIDKIQRIDLKNEKLPSRAKRKVKNNSIIYSTVRPNQCHFGILKNQPQNFLVSTGFAVIDIDELIADSDFIYYYLTQAPIIERLHSIAEQSVSAYPSIKSSDIADLVLLLPSLEIQKRISNILSSLDDKIELNNRINDNLEQQAQAIFKNMFPSINSGNTEVGTYIVPKRGKNLTEKNAIFGDVPVVAGGLEPSIYHNKSNTTAPLITISASGANAGYIKLWHIPVWSSDSSFIDSNMTENVYFWYIVLKLRQKEIFDSQTGSVQPHIYPKHIAQLKIETISKEQITIFTQKVTPLFLMMGTKILENEKLIKIRDALLPKLISGKIDVSNLII